MCAPLAAASRAAAASAPAALAPRRVQAGIWCIPVPVPHGLVASTLVYAIETDRGPVLIDAGCDDDLAWRGLVSGLRECGLDVRSTYGVLLTHAHSDHHGLTSRVRQASGAWVAMHALDARMLAETGYLGPGWPGRLAGVLAYCGAPAADQAAVSAMRRTELPAPDRLLADGDTADVPGWQVTTVWTPGHTPGHLCYRLADRGLLFCGDHVLPTMSSRVGVAEYGGAPDALGDMLGSLERVAALEADQAWPGHEFAFGDHRDRCRALAARHRDRLRQLRQVLDQGPVTVWTAAERMARRRSLDQLEPGRRRLILLEVLARLEHLQAAGEVSARVLDGVAAFRLTERER